MAETVLSRGKAIRNTLLEVIKYLKISYYRVFNRENFAVNFCCLKNAHRKNKIKSVSTKNKKKLETKKFKTVLKNKKIKYYNKMQIAESKILFFSSQ